MGLRINTNSSAVTALRNLHVADRAQAKSLERLSTGLRINRASDDPSGLVISEQLRAQIASLKQAMENTESASNLIGTAEAALAEISGLLIGIRESALFALNEGGTSSEQISAEQDAVDAAVGAIDRIAGSTRFGRTQLLDGSAQLEVTGQSGEVADVNLRALNFDGFASRQIDMLISTAAEQASHVVTGVTRGGAGAVAGGNSIFRISGSKGTQTITIGAGASGASLMEAINLVSLNTGVYASADAAGAAGVVLLRSMEFGADEFVTFEQVAGSGTFAGAEAQSVTGEDIGGTIEGVRGTGKGNILSLDSFALSVEVEFNASATGADYAVATAYNFTTVKSGLNFQLNTEANPNDATRIGIAGMHSALLGSTEQIVNLGGGNTLTVGGIVATLRSGSKNDLQTDAGNAIRIIDAAIDDVSDMRAQLGALKSNVLDSNTRSLGVAIENLTSSESGIRDLDFAAETAEFTRTQIMFQAGTSVMASANLIPQTILSLLQ